MIREEKFHENQYDHKGYVYKNHWIDLNIIFTFFKLIYTWKFFCALIEFSNDDEYYIYLFVRVSHELIWWKMWSYSLLCAVVN